MTTRCTTIDSTATQPCSDQTTERTGQAPQSSFFHSARTLRATTSPIHLSKNASPSLRFNIVTRATRREAAALPGKPVKGLPIQGEPNNLPCPAALSSRRQAFHKQSAVFAECPTLPKRQASNLIYSPRPQPVKAFGGVSWSDFPSFSIPLRTTALAAASQPICFHALGGAGASGGSIAAQGGSATEARSAEPPQFLPLSRVNHGPG